MTLNFGILGFLFLAVIFALTLLYHHRQLAEARRGFFSLMNVKFSVVAALMLLLLGFLSIYTLNNYFYADKHVYRNADHHALRLDGITIGNPRGFLLAEASNRAFFDDERMGGSVTVESGECTDSIQLKLTNFTRTLFLNQYNAEGRCIQRSLLNGHSLLRFGEQDTLFLRTRNGGVYRFFLQTVSQDSVNYHLVLPNGSDCLTDEHRFLTQGLPLSTLTQGTFNAGADFSDLHIVRTNMHMQVRKDQRISIYRNVDFAVEVLNTTHSADDNYVTDARTSHTQWRSLRQTGVKMLNVPLGAFFSLGYGSGSTQPVCFARHGAEGDSLELLFKMPGYHYLTQLPDEEESSISVRTSMLRGNDDLSELPENIILFDLFAHADNINSMNPLTLSFVSGSTTEQMEFNYTLGNADASRNAEASEMVALAGDRIEGVKATASHHGVEWLLSVENLKDTAPWSPFGIKLRMALFIIMLALLMLWGGATNMTTKGAARRNLFTTVEFVAYAVTIYLVAFRWFLLWRTSVFPPVEDVSYYEFYGLFRNTSNGNWLTLMMIALVAVVAVGKVLIFRRRVRTKESSITFGDTVTSVLNRIDRPWLVPALLLAVSAVVFVLSRWVFRGTPILRISLPVFAYLAFTAVIDRWLSPCPHFRLEDRNRQRDFWLRNTPLHLIMAHVATAGLFAAMLLVIDSGYGILFLTFSVFWTLWMLQQHVGYYMWREHWRVGVIFMLLLVMGWLIYKYKDIIGFADQHDAIVVLAVMGVAGLAIGFVISWILLGPISPANPTTPAKPKGRRATMYIVLSLAFALAFMLGGWGFRHYLKDGGEHTAQRIAVHFSEPDDVMEKITDDATEYRYLQAALNHSIIGQYTDRGDNVRLFFEGGHGYFKMQPHSKVGALWNAQLTDISLVRFVISEHSERLPLVLIGFFLLMLVAAARQPLYHRWARSLLIQIPLLLFVHSLLIWMATTQRFIFLGQDFPMISINSRLTLVYYFGLVGIWLLVALYEKRNFYKLYTTDADGRAQNDDAADPLDSHTLQLSPHTPHTPNYWRFTIARTDARRAFVALLLCMIGAAFASRGTTDNSLELTRLMNQLTQRVGTINKLLRAYQDETPIRLQHDMSGALSAFNRQENIDSLFADYPFGQRLWHHYLERDSRNNNSHLILHTHLNREGKIVLGTVNKFHNPTLPVPIEKQWRGSIVGTDGRYLARNVMLNGHRAFFFPQGNSLFWLRNLTAELLYQNSDQYANNEDEDVVLTLSPMLTDTIYSRLSAASAARSSVIVATGRGDVLALVDYDREFGFDPNDSHRIERFTDSLYMNGMMGSELERRAFGNKNLMRIQRGPGSTQKPLTWSAVAARVDLPWNTLYIAPYEGKIAHADGTHFTMSHFNGMPFLQRHPFVPRTDDENYGQQLSVRGYMTHSSNVYNALMAYIGSFPARQLDNPDFLIPSAQHDGTTLLSKVSPSEIARTSDYRMRFPLIKSNGQMLSLNKPIDSNDQPGCLFQEAMEEMFLGEDDNDDASDSVVASLGSQLSIRKRLSSYAYVERSCLMNRQGPNTRLLMEYAVRSTAIGAQNIWEVTPWKMAEAYGRMASLNAAFRLHVFAGDSFDYEPFAHLTAGYRDARPQQMLGMSDVLSSGTGKRMKTKLDVQSDDDERSNRVGRYYIYAKTGTISANRHEGDKHRLGVIIADHDLATTPIDDLDAVRYVVLYFTMDSKGQWDTYVQVIKDVMASHEFLTYMER